MGGSSGTHTSGPAATVTRPAVSVLVPFAGRREDAQQMATAFAALRLVPGDEGVVADNSRDGVLATVELPPGWRVVPATREGSPAHTRNTAALESSCEWLLFLDSDTQPPDDLLDRFFAKPIPDDVGVVGGKVLSDRTQTSIAARWAESRGMTTQESHMVHPFRPYFLSASLLMRQSVWRELGGFYEGIFNGEDVDFCWRAVEAGWKLHFNDEAAVVHLHRESVRALARQAAVRAASASWVYRRWPQATRPKRPGPLLIAKGAMVTPVMLLAGQRERAALRALDVTTQVAERLGTLGHNRARPRPSAATAGPQIEIWCDEFPLRSDGSVAEQARALAGRGRPVRVTAVRRPDEPALGVRDVCVHYLEDDTTLERLAALVRLLARRPLAALRDLRGKGAGAAQPLWVLTPSVSRLRGDPGVEVRVHPEAAAAPAARRAASLAGRPCRAARPGPS